MALVNAICTNCGGTLKVDNTTDALICSYCNSPFITEKAINNYNTTHNHFTTNVYNMYGGNSADFVIRGGVLEKYNGASTEVKIPNTVTHIRGAFKDCSGLISVEIPDSVQEIGEAAFSGCKSLTSIEIPEKVEEIGNNAFAGCKNLDTIEIPDSVEEIGSFAFAGCENLDSIMIPVSVEKIGDNAFAECKNLYTVTIPDDVKEIGNNTFKNCSSLTEVYFDKINENRHAFSDNFLTLYESRISKKKCACCGGNFNTISYIMSQIFDFILFNVKCKNCGRIKNY